MISTSTIVDTIIKIIDILGYLGPYLLGIITMILLFFYKLYTLLIFYSIGYGLNTIINLILKGLIKQPRPTEDKHIFTLEKTTDKRISFDRYGMPSGHAQSVCYSTIFVWFALKNVWITLFYLFIVVASVTQRIKYKNHDWKQVIIGMIVGIIVGYIMFEISQKKLKGNLKRRADDNGPKI